MKRTLIAAAFLAGLLAVQAQERMPREEALKAALFLGADLKELLNLPIPTEPDIKRVVAIQDDDYHVIVFPEFRLSADPFAKAGKEPKPVGQLWLHNLVPENQGQRAPQSKLHSARVHAMDQDADAVGCALGVCKSENGGSELLIYSKDKEPVTRVAMKSISVQQEDPIEISAERKDHSERITLRFLGKYRPLSPPPRPTKKLTRFNDMKRTLIAAAFLTGLVAVQAQERMPREEALKTALFVSANLKEMLNTPIPTDPISSVWWPYRMTITGSWSSRSSSSAQTHLPRPARSPNRWGSSGCITWCRRVRGSARLSPSCNGALAAMGLEASGGLRPGRVQE